MNCGMGGFANAPPRPLPETPSIARRLASMVYETLLVFAIVFLAGLMFQAVVNAVTGVEVHSGYLRALFQLYLLAVLGVYFVWCWHRGGQTLPMKTWKLQLMNASNGPVSVRQAALRYLLACLSIALAGAGFLWAVFDRDRQFLHDRLAGTRIAMSEGGSSHDSGRSRHVAS